MLESKISQFSLSDEGKILWQEKLNNPLPGMAVAQLSKGEHALNPIITVLENEITAKYDLVELKNSLTFWLNTHLFEVLEPLMLLKIPNGVEVKNDAVSQIAVKVYDGLGIVQRGDIEELIAKLTPETRGDLRHKKIRLGPILAFIPALNKPAAVRLKSTLLSLFHDIKLPAPVPADGVVSVKIEDKNPDEVYFRSIGYPLYGSRAVRIDMLDRVINCVYDTADKGKFQARHEMAEWLGCSISDLYDVLISMGHVKIYDPADNEMAVDGENSEDKKENVKPELATFRLKKGKAFQKPMTAGEKKKPFKKKEGFSKKPNKPDKNKSDKKRKKDNSPKIISIEAKKNEADSPFAILQQLKNK